MGSIVFALSLCARSHHAHWALVGEKGARPPVCVSWLFAGGSFPGLTILPRSSPRHGGIVMIGALRRTWLTVSATMGDHCDILTLISLRSLLWVFSTSSPIMRADDPQRLLHNQALRTNCVTCLSIGTKLVFSFRRESKGEPWTCAGKGERDATEPQNKDQGEAEPHTLGGDTVGDCGLILGRSTVTAAAGPRDHEAQPGLLPARYCPWGRA